MRGLLVFIFSFTISVTLLKSNDPDSLSFENHVFDQRIKTVQLYKEGWNLSYPVIQLNSEEKLVLHFDLLGDKIETCYYTFIHCSKDWERSDIFTNSYLDGFPDNEIEDFKPSFNTTVNYVHYKLSFPNDRIKITLSGNYILVVYPYENPDKPVLTQRFVVTENAARISITTHRPQVSSDSNADQQVDFTVDLSGFEVTDPYNNIYSFVLQNGRWDNAKKNLKPDFYGGNELKYNSLSDKNIFAGGNEYRYFDIKSIRYQSEFIKSIDYMAPYYNVFLYPSEDRESKPYFYWKDFNGKYYIAVQEGQNPETDADYINVYFTLPSKYMLAGGTMYVSGNLNNWSFNDNNLMIFNSGKGQYECTMLLKQGWYNYEYVFLKDGDTRGVASVFEGSHYETENDYQVLVYYRNPRDRFDRVIGTAIANTLNRLSY
jgi:hypothetical protein